MKKDDNLTFDTFAKRNMSIALTLVYFVIAFAFTCWIDYLLMFKDSNLNYMIPKLFIAIIISVVIYIAIFRRFLTFLDYSEIEKKYDFLYSVAIILSCAVFVLFTLLLFALAIILLYVFFSLFYGIFTGQFGVIKF
ncbi:hypothetical protein IKQ26_03880 [bacterium]|nr:hypothetical protein [bacterium]